MPKRAAVPQNVFGKSASALDKLTGRAPTDDVVPENGTTVTPSSGNTVLPQQIADEAATREKITFYLRPDQLDKLDELALDYKRQTGQRINRNELVRRLIDRCNLSMVLGER